MKPADQAPRPDQKPRAPEPDGRRHRGQITWLPASQAAVYDLLTYQPAPCTVAALAALTGQHPNTVREHLDRLIASGLAERTRLRSRPGRGRPAWLYTVTDTKPEAQTDQSPPQHDHPPRY